MSPYNRAPRPAEIAAALAFTLGLWFAVVLATLGVESALFDEDIISDARAGFILGPAMMFVSLAVTGATLASFATSRRHHSSTTSPYALASLIIAAASYGSYVIAALAGWVLLVPGNPADSLDFALSVAIGWPAATILVVSFITAMSFFAYLSWRTRNVL